MRSAVNILFFLLLSHLGSHAQELFLHAEPASTVPGKTLGIRFFSENYKEINHQYRDMSALRVMYGLTSKLTVMATASIANHHSRELPPDFPDHNTPQIGVKLPFLFNGVNVYAKYRLYANDGQNSHLRIAAYSEYGFMNVAHDEAEPNVEEDTKGYAGGLICTYLHQHFAVSLTGGGILPARYYGQIPDYYPGLPSVPARVDYGKAINGDLSFGYLLFPHEYKSYEQTNLNVYVEFVGKSYGAADIYLQNIGIPGSWYEVKRPDIEVLQAGQYIEVHPGVQTIIKSDLRIDFSMGFPLYHRSYVHYYPIYMVGVQRYFYSGRKKHK